MPASFSAKWPVDVPAQQEIEKGQQENDADGAPEQPVKILPPENALELVERHPLVHMPVFGSGLVLAKNLFPVGLRQRRNGADQRLPFGHREAGVREPRHTADHHHDEYERTAGKQPDCNRRTAGLIH